MLPDLGTSLSVHEGKLDTSEQPAIESAKQEKRRRRNQLRAIRTNGAEGCIQLLLENVGLCGQGRQLDQGQIPNALKRSSFTSNGGYFWFGVGV